MSRYALWALLLGMVTHSFNPRLAYAGPCACEPPSVSTSNCTGTASEAPTTPSPSAHAQTAQSSPQRVWYGGTILGIDLLAASLVAVGVATSSGIVLLGSGLSYTLGGPVVHGMHHNAGKVGGSFGLRLGLPVVGGMIGALAGASASGGCSGEMCQLGSFAVGGAIGLGVGMITASALDLTLLAYDSPSHSASPQVALLPAIESEQARRQSDYPGKLVDHRSVRRPSRSLDSTTRDAGWNLLLSVGPTSSQRRCPPKSGNPGRLHHRSFERAFPDRSFHASRARVYLAHTRRTLWE
ncbi:MAG: hypothetical protein QM784_10705 [Polyangiaceae bacterium]